MPAATPEAIGPEKEFAVTPNTKVGLLVGLMFIIGMGLLLSRQVGDMPRRDLDSLVERSPKASPSPMAALAGHRDNRVAMAGGRGGVVSDDPIGRPVAPGHDTRVTPSPTPVPYASPTPVPTPLASPFASPLPSPAPIPVALPPGTRTHRVAAGENLGMIATKYYQTRRRTDLILAANKGTLSDPNRVREGTVLVIPPAPPAGPIAVAVAPSPAPIAMPPSPAPAIPPTPAPSLPPVVVAPVPPPSPGPVASPVATPSPAPVFTPVPGVIVPPSRSPGAVNPLSPTGTPPAGGPALRPVNPLDSPLLERVDPARPSPGSPILTPVRPTNPLTPGGPTAGAPASPIGAAVPAAPVAARTYQIKAGDTLCSIAASQLGGRGQWKAVYDANKDLIPDPDHLAIGTTIRLPEPRVAMHN